MEPIDILWGLAPGEVKLELALNLITEILKVAEKPEPKQDGENSEADEIIDSFISLVVAMVAVVYAINTHRAAQLASYAATNNCTWHYNGTAYGDNRDYTCK